VDDESAMRAIAARLGHAFADLGPLREALTHASFAHERPELAPRDNERLEMFGDAVLQWAVSALLWERFPDATAGELTRRRADLVCEEGLAEIAEALALGADLRLGRGEDRSGGRTKPRLLASAFEACIAAVYLDGGPEAALGVCRTLFLPRLKDSAPGARDFKTRLQEVFQERGARAPRYDLCATGGPDHARQFEVAVFLDAEELGRGTGRSKIEAEQIAAQVALVRLAAR
jgi:ribonuclease-3